MSRSRDARPGPRELTSRLRRRTLKAPVIMFVVALVLAVALLVLWNVVLAIDYQRIKELASRATAEGGGAFHWTFIAIGSLLFVVTISLLSVIGAILIQEIRFSQRLSQFIAVFTHELNSPLASIKLFAQTMRQQPVAEEKRIEFLDLILSDVERLRTQISNVLRAAHLDLEGSVGVQTEVVDLVPYLQDYVEQRQKRADCRGPGFTLRLEAPDETVLAAVDPLAMREVLDNLVGNAFKYGGAAGGAVVIALSEDPGGVIAIEVRDRGAGIAEPDLESVFDRFDRGSQGKHGSGAPGQRRQRGSGLGLWIVRAVLMAHRGTVRAVSDGLGKGTTIRMELPRPDDEPDEGAGEAREGAGEAREGAE